MRPFDPERTAGKPGGSDLLDSIIDGLRETLRSIQRAVTNDHLVTVTLKTTPTQVFHGLNGPPLTVEIVGRDAGEVIFEPAVINSQRAKFVYLTATGPVTATVRFT